jgi:hypothetical protein
MSDGSRVDMTDDAKKGRGTMRDSDIVEDDVPDYSDCPYLKRWAGVPKEECPEGDYGPGTCIYGCSQEPVCVTG